MQTKEWNGETSKLGCTHEGNDGAPIEAEGGTVHAVWVANGVQCKVDPTEDGKPTIELRRTLVGNRMSVRMATNGGTGTQTFEKQR
jgi:hypothetical protein